MKLRNGFVSNSSSSSFVLSKNYVSPFQLEQIYNHIEIGKALGISNADEYARWSIYEQDGNLEFSTDMDNFDMEEFLEKIGVDTSKIIDRG